jgi:dihydroorotate dehydrogenase electron transfer subunit
MAFLTKLSIQRKLKVKSNQEIADKIYKLELEGDYDLEEFKPGRFLHIKCSSGIDPLLRRPMSVCDIDNAGKLMTVLYRSEGRGTQLLSQKKHGDILDVLAPLGTSFDQGVIKSGQTALLVGGGIGVPPLYYLGRKLKEKGVKIISVLGFNSAKDVFYEEEFAKLGELYISTVDGSHGVKGLVVDLLPGLEYDALYSCGPNPMLKALQTVIPRNKKAFISIEERMGCGVGACLACVCKPSPEYVSDSGYLRACTEGPVLGMWDIAFS